MQDRKKIVFCDTGFFIRLVGEIGKLHDSTLAYFKYFLDNRYILRMSTISIAEFCVKDTIQHLPLRNIIISPFNAYSAVYTGGCAEILLKEKSKGARVANDRVIILNDVKIMAQAQCDKADYYITSDTKSKRMYDVLKRSGKVTYQFIDIHDPYDKVFGCLDFKNKV